VNGTTLTPRQRLTATPYALYSAKPWQTWGPGPGGGAGDIWYRGAHVGIGTTSPAAKLHLDTSDGELYGLRHSLTLPDTTILDLVTSLLNNPTNGYSEGQFGTHSPHPLTFITGNSRRMTLDTSGRLGIGIDTPSQKLSVAGTVQSTTGGFMFP